ncbi:MAG TPA: peptidyl-prolyl cis-trans isomerase, partial [Thermoanaerobaculia bacterium]
MNRIIIGTVALFFATTVFAQPVTPAAAEDQKIVAVINGEVITRPKLDALYNNMTAQMRAQYERSGGKMAFLDNYVAKRLLLQEAMKSGFDKRPDVQGAIEAAKEAAIFDRYVKDVVAAPIVTEAEMRKYYDEHKSDFATPETAKVRHIIISFDNKSKPDAMDLIKRAATEIRAGAPSQRDQSMEVKQILLSRFIAAARKYSEDGVAQSGGDLGWVARGTLDKNFEDAAFNMPPMTISGIVESQFGYHLIFIEETKPAGTQPFEDVRTDLREFLIAQHSADLMGAV